MRFTPNHMVSYHGNFYEAGKTFDIEPAEAEEMQQYGNIEPADEPADEPPRKGKKKE